MLWTAAAVFAYAYVLWSLRAVQGKEQFPEFPGTLLKLLGISASTSVLATGVRVIKGPEGAGRTEPGWRDLITTGEIVAMDKVQLVVWTLIGLFSFMASVINQDPLHLQSKMQDLPTALWELAGLSGAIFVAGKSVREPGPVLSAVTVKERSPGGVFDVELRGLNLSQDAAFYTGAKRISIDRISGGPVTPMPADGPKNSPVPAVTVPGDTAASRMVRGLHLEVSNYPELATVGNFVIENPDGQKAECPYTPSKAL